MNCDYQDAGRALLAAKLQRGDADSELAHAIRDALGGVEQADILAEAIGAVSAELKLRVRRSWHESQMAEGVSERAALEDSLSGHARRNSELCAELKSTREKLDSLAYDIGELPARLALEVPAASSLIRALPDIRQAVSEADSVLNDNA